MKQKLFIGILAILLLLPIGFSALIDDPNIVAYWNFNGNANDYFGNYNGTVNGATLSTNYPLYNISGNGSTHSYYFDDTNNYIAVGSTSDFEFNNDYSICAWINLNSISGNDMIFDKRDANDDGWFFGSIGGKLTLAINYDDTISNVNLNTNEFVFVVATINRSGDGKARLYINGIETTYSSQPGISTETISVNTVARIGMDSYATTNRFNGYIDEPAIFNKTLSLTEIQEIYNYGLFRSTLQNFTITAKNEFNNESITTFNATIDGITYQTSTGSIETHILKNDTNLYDIDIFGLNNQFFETSVYNVSVASDYTFYLKQSDIKFNVTNFMFNQSVPDFNITINGTIKVNDSNWYLPTGTYNATFSKTGYFNKTQEITINALDNKTITITEVYNRALEVRAKTKSDIAINNFSVTINLLNTAYAGYSNTLSTTNGLITFPVIDGNYNITIDATGYAITTNTTTINQTGTSTFNFSLYTTNSILFSIFDESTGNLITQLVKLTLISDSFSYVFNTTDGTKYTDLLSPQTYMIFAESEGYPLRSYSFTLTDRSFNEFNIYMINETGLDEIIATVYSEGYTQTIENAYIKVLKYFAEDNTYRLVETVKTNFEGVAVLNLQKKTQYYKFVIEFPLGEVRFTSSPTFIVGDTLTFELQPTFPRDYDLYFGIDYELNYNNLTNNFRFDFNSDENLMYCLRIFENIRGQEILINQTCSVSQTGTILLGIDPKNNTLYVAKAFVSFDNGQSFSFLTNNIVDTREVADLDNNTSMFLILFLSIVFMAIGVSTSANFMLLLTPLPLMFGIYLGIINLASGVGIGILFMFIAVILYGGEY